MGVAKKRKFRWSEAARLQVLEAVVKVEETMIKESYKGRRDSCGRRKTNCNGSRKWNAVMTRLPPQFRERTWNPRKKKYSVPICTLMFNNILYAYRSTLTGRVSKGRALQRLSEPVIKLLQRRESLVNAKRSVRNSLPSPRSRGEQRSKPKRQCLRSAREVGTATSSVHNLDFESAEETPTLRREGRSARRCVADREQSTEKDAASFILLSRSVDESDVHLENSFAAPRNRVRASAQTQLRTRSQARAHVHDSQSAATRSSAERRATLSEQRCNARKSRGSYAEEHMQALTDGPLRKLSVELSRLSSWVLNQEIPLTQSVLNEVGSTDIRPGKRQKSSVNRSVAGTDTEIFDELIQESVSRTIDNQVRDSFDKLRTLILKELKKTSLDLAQKVVEEAHFLEVLRFSGSHRVSRGLACC